MDEEKGRKLARFRVGEKKFMGKNMEPAEIKLRHDFIKTMLRRIEPWQNLTDIQIADVRIYKQGADWYIEDTDFYEYIF